MSDDHDSDLAAKLELAWAAGFFDGEGTTYLCQSHYRYYYVGLSVPQIECEPLERFMRAVGNVGSIGGPYEHGSSGGGLIYRWRLTRGVAVREVLRRLWPYLCSTKRKQAERALAGEVRKFGGACKDRTHCPQGHPYDEANTYRRGSGHRSCRICGAEIARRARRKCTATKARLKAEQASGSG